MDRHPAQWLGVNKSEKRSPGEPVRWLFWVHGQPGATPGHHHPCGALRAGAGLLLQEVAACKQARWVNWGLCPTHTLHSALYCTSSWGLRFCRGGGISPLRGYLPVHSATMSQSGSHRGSEPGEKNKVSLHRALFKALIALESSPGLNLMTAQKAGQFSIYPSKGQVTRAVCFIVEKS